VTLISFTPNPVSVIANVSSVAPEKNVNDVNCAVWQPTQPDRSFGIVKNPVANLGLLLFEKNLIGIDGMYYSINHHVCKPDYMISKRVLPLLFNN
jgi:hypothetical protein